MSFDRVTVTEPLSPDEGLAIRISGLCKCFHIYDKPLDRLKQFLLPGLSAAFRGGRVPSPYYREFWALRDVSFTVRKGETIAVIGLNGSGKSTLLQMIAGTLTPTAGSIEVHGRVAALLELGSGFNPEFTGRENVYLNAAILGLSRAATDCCLDEILAFADIGDFIDQPVKTYSSGMMMRLAFAVSVHVEPDILIVDEALAVGDAAFQFKCLERLKHLSESGVTLLFVSHDMNTVKAFCDQAIYMEHGVIKAMGTAAEMVERYYKDVQQARHRVLGGEGPMAFRSGLSPDTLLAFGTGAGRIVSGCFSDTGTTRAHYVPGQRVGVNVGVELGHRLMAPSISLVLHDHRMIVISGKQIRVESVVPAGSSGGVVSVAFDFVPALQAASYFITLKLEDQPSPQQTLLIDKQSGVLMFEIMAADNPGFLGLVDMNITTRILDGDDSDPSPAGESRHSGAG